MTDEKKKEFIAANLDKVAPRFKNNFNGYNDLDGDELGKLYTNMLGVVRRAKKSAKKTEAEAYEQAEVSVNDFQSNLKELLLGHKIKTEQLQKLKADLTTYMSKIDAAIEANKEADIEAKRKAVNEAIDAYNAISGENKEHI